MLAQYNSVNQRANQTADTQFQQYGGAFTAPVNAQQGVGIAGIDSNANAAQPYYTSAANNLYGAQDATYGYNTGAENTLTGAQSATAPVNSAAEAQTAASSAPLSGADIQRYLSPYLNTVLGSESALLNQNNQEQQQGALGTAISSGAFGGDRTGIAAANLEQQQNLSNANIYSGILNQGYQSALSTAQGQQQVGLAGAAQEAQIGQTAYGEGANTASELAGLGQTAYGEGANTASEYASLGTGAQTAALTGANAEIGAGTLEQQTQQAQDTAQYNQFLQQQSYPFQVDQFLANIAEGTGSLSGSTTTTQQPGGFFSDERLKTDKRPIGKTFDGQTIYSYKMKGDPRTRIGLMAQDVEEKHPEAVGVSAGYKTVDYGKATREAANERHFASGGVVPIRPAMAVGGEPYDLDSILALQQQMYQPHMQKRDINGQQGGAGGHQITVASGSPAPQPSGYQNTMQAINLGKLGYQGYKHFNPTPKTNSPGSGGSPPAATASDPAPSGVGTYPSADAPAIESSTAPSDLTMTPMAADAGAADASGVAPAAADAAAPAAADAAASAAAPAAADAAAGAAGSAAAGAGADVAVGAGADAAAALAAEYAVGAAADAAIIAAKRGGRIHKAGGGTPYESMGEGTPYAADDGVMAIPDDANSNKLKTAGPLKKQPTGLQTMMMMADPNQAGSIAGSVFSNQALASGGGVAPRRGYEDGGPPTLTDDSGNPQEVDADMPNYHKFSGVAAEPVAYRGGVDAAPVGVDAGDTPKADIPRPDPDSPKEAKKQPDPDVDHWYNHVHAADVVPLLSGIAAMGTAPTRSWGTALAAGLGAGAQSYMPAQEAAANIGQTQARTQGYGLQNQMTQAKLDALHEQLSAHSAPDAGNTQTPVDPATDPYGYRAQFNVPKAMTAQEESDYQRAGARDSILGTKFKDLVTQRFQNRLAMDQNKAQQTAQAKADDLYRTAVSNPDPAMADEATRRYNDIHQWTGDNYEDRGGVLYNSRTNQRPIGDAAQTIPPSVLANLTAEGNKLVEVPTSTPGVTRQMPQYQAVPGNYRSADDYARALWQKSMVPTAAPAPVRTAPAPGPAATAVGLASQPPRPARVVPVRAAVPPAKPAESQLPTLPGLDLSTLPRIPESREQLHVTPGTTKTSMYDTMNKQRDEILNTASGTHVLANQKEALLTPMLNKIASINPRDVGPGSETYKAFLSLKDAIFKESGKPSDLVDMGVIDKFANQLGVQNVRGLLEGQRITNQEMMTFMNRASASTTQPIDVMKQIVAYTKANNDFDLLAANTKTQALTDPTVDPRQINGAIDARRDAFVQEDMAKILGQTAPPKAGAAPAVETRTYQGHVYIYDPASGPRNDPKNWKLQ